MSDVSPNVYDADPSAALVRVQRYTTDDRNLWSRMGRPSSCVSVEPDNDSRGVARDGETSGNVFSERVHGVATMAGAYVGEHGDQCEWDDAVLVAE